MDVHTALAPLLRPEADRGTIPTRPYTYGASIRGVPLHVYLPRSGEPPTRLIHAGIHGHEPESTAVLSAALRMVDPAAVTAAVVLCANPDGTVDGTRGNARGVDLNRNFPTADWAAGTTLHRWQTGNDRAVTLSSGIHGGSEPETDALIRLVRQLEPEDIISIHAPLACIDDPDRTDVGRFLTDATGLQRVDDVGYPTPGSFGRWCRDLGYLNVTWELPCDGVKRLVDPHVHAAAALLTHTDRRT